MALYGIGYMVLGRGATNMPTITEKILFTSPFTILSCNMLINSKYVFVAHFSSEKVFPRTGMCDELDAECFTLQ